MKQPFNSTSQTRLKLVTHLPMEQQPVKQARNRGRTVWEGGIRRIVNPRNSPNKLFGVMVTNGQFPEEIS